MPRRRLNQIKIHHLLVAFGPAEKILIWRSTGHDSARTRAREFCANCFQCISRPQRVTFHDLSIHEQTHAGQIGFYPDAPTIILD